MYVGEGEEGASFSIVLRVKQSFQLLSCAIRQLNINVYFRNCIANNKYVTPDLF